MLSKLFRKIFQVEVNKESTNVNSVDDVVSASLAQSSSGNIGDCFFRFSLSSEQRVSHIQRLGRWMNDKLADVDLHIDDFPAAFNDFEKMLSASPDVGMGTSGAGSLLWLFMMARALDSKQVVESGVYKGTSLNCWLHALPTAEIRAYDVSFDNLVVRNERIRLTENDWKHTPPLALSERDLCYFDDHINNAQRICEAADFGFKHLIFDDAPDVGGLKYFRFPGVPTAPMIWNESIPIGETISWEWQRGSGVYSYTARQEDFGHAKEKIEFVWEIPSHEHLTGQECNIQCYVRLK